MGNTAIRDNSDVWKPEATLLRLCNRYDSRDLINNHRHEEKNTRPKFCVGGSLIGTEGGKPHRKKYVVYISKSGRNSRNKTNVKRQGEPNVRIFCRNVVLVGEKKWMNDDPVNL